MEQKQNDSKKGLTFVEFYRIRKSKNGNILIFLNEKTCISVPIKYIEKVISNNSEMDSKNESA